MLQVRDSHEGFVEIVQLQNTGQQEEAGDQNAAEEFRQSKRLQAHRCQPEEDQTHFLVCVFQPLYFKAEREQAQIL